MLVGTLPVKVRFVDDSAFDKQIPNILCGNILDTLHLEIVINLYKSKKIGQRESLRIQQVLREPDNATDKTVTWKSEDPTVATVDSNGKVIIRYAPEQNKIKQEKNKIKPLFFLVLFCFFLFFIGREAKIFLF